MIENYKPEKTHKFDVKMKLILTGYLPEYHRPRSLSPIEKDIIVFVQRKNGNATICVDHRKLNEKIIKDRFPLSLIENLDSLQRA